LAVKIRAVTLEHLMRLEADDDVEIAGRSSVGPCLALAGEAHAVVLVDARRDLDRQRLVGLDAPGALAGRTGVRDDLAGTMALRAGLRARPRFRATAVAGRAGFEGRDADLDLGAPRGLLERELEVVAQV